MLGVWNSLSWRVGAMADFKVTELISLADMADLMQAGSEISNRYTPPNRDEIDRLLLDE